MLVIDDTSLPDAFDNVEIVRRFGRRPISHAFHDVDGTHSLIRDWAPPMSLLLRTVIEEGLPEGYDDEENARRLTGRLQTDSTTSAGVERMEETDRFCVESAGLSALTQMEWAVRRAIEEGTIPAERVGLTPQAERTNAEIVRRIWAGEERFDAAADPPALVRLLAEHAPRLFQLYERVLDGACRDANLTAARRDPAAWRVPGALEFMRMLRNFGAVNYFITGAVIPVNERGQPEGGMYEEVLAVGFDVGPGRMVQALHGCRWDRKTPKYEVMRRLCREENIEPAKVLVVGDGRGEIAAGAAMGAVTVSRLPADAARQRELHRSLGTNVILADYTSERLPQLFDTQ